MKKYIYVCPATGGKLDLVVEKEQNGIIENGFFVNKLGEKYPVKEGIPDFTFPSELSPEQLEQHMYYETNAESYDDFQYLTFAIQNADEEKTRKEMVSLLNLNNSSKVLELSCGTGNDSQHIAGLLDKTGEFFVQDLSPAMLKQCRKRLKAFSVPVDFSVGNATYLSYPDNYFDAVFSFGGLNIFEDKKRSLQEMVRVTKPNGKIVVGDESMPPWLYDTEFGRILLDNNPLFKFEIPFDSIPVEAREVTVRWIIGGVYYLIDFLVGEGPPTGNFDLEIPGARGGTLRTRYHGKLQGVTSEVKELVMDALQKSGVSQHKWLDSALLIAAEKELAK